ncbi:H/ACA ribonucleoprotein complex non-core subunit naf1 [Tyrophagus putrescentiae]|nr:H/ACA ribonucleoprotein complex non-core subunit naf1 [Tyrophagus putrescentiae]
MASLSLICEYGSSSSSEEEDDNIVEVMEVVEVKEKQPDSPSVKPSTTTFFDADILSVVESLISRVERRHHHHYHNTHHHHHHQQQQQQQQYPFSTSKYRTPNDDSIDEDSNSSSSDSDSDLSIWSAFSEDDDDDDDGDENFDGNNTSSKAKHCVTKGELTVDDLPPMERLQISVDVRCLTQVGIVCSMVNQLVVVQSFKSVPVLDLDTVLFCREGTSIGQIFDVIGPVKQPNYVLRFNSPEEAVVDCKLTLNAPVYYAEEQQQQAGPAGQPHPVRLCAAAGAGEGLRRQLEAQQRAAARGGRLLR